MGPLRSVDPVELSRTFLQAARRGDGDSPAGRLAELDQRSLDELDDDGRTAFWTNVYNATVQHRLREDPDQFDRRSFFGRPLITVAGQDLTLDDIEHGLLRRSKWKYGLGYLPKPFPGSFEKRHRVSAVDERIHFALNCGAASCPAIAGYDAASLDEQLDAGTAAYLESTVTYDSDAGRVTVPRFCLWYRGDFGGRRGIRSMLRRYGCIPEGATPSLSYAEYDWSLALDAFRE